VRETIILFAKTTQPIQITGEGFDRNDSSHLRQSAQVGRITSNRATYLDHGVFATHRIYNGFASARSASGFIVACNPLKPLGFSAKLNPKNQNQNPKTIKPNLFFAS